MNVENIFENEQVNVEEIEVLSNPEIRTRISLIDTEIKILKNEHTRLKNEYKNIQEKIKDNVEKIHLNKMLPYLVANVVESLDLQDDEDEQEPKDEYDLYDNPNNTIYGSKSKNTPEEGFRDIDDEKRGKCMVIKTSTRQTIFLPVPGLIEASELKPGDLVGVNKDSYLIIDKLPPEYDNRVKAMEVIEKPTEDYSDIGGLDKQIEDLVEAIVLPMLHKEKFEKIGIKPPKGVLMHGPPGTGKTLLARACASQTNATFLKLAGPQLVQMFIGDGAKMVRDAFNLAKEKAPAIIFIDELDAIGTKRFDSELSGDREVQRTMLELLNQLDGFSTDETVKVIAATNRPDTLDPALLRSGRLDRKIELPHPNEESRARILQIHSRKMNVHKDVNFEELARSTDDFNGAQLKAVCVEAGMIALRRGATEIDHEDFIEGITSVLSKKKSTLNYFT
ncbi:26S protease regulatory subunit 6A, putative [Plasmodium vinckei vinckei]|uniref:26S protease regulatory subunit 6A, putative n=1 Tax=Plasmodium vinckei vinckei TaxID=54757 RepID=A0A449BSQ8_PLAVN|nr:26S protease regulatory subunit 6A, putative [Plasmodium vinckei vinckei]KEG02240.1 26S protease regulatory subunit 6A like A [Plasmodium vinckei vinckei]VEV56481.1 26S protease regulatory subunit 6A, putative [Plasmodium vinckei vinckei]